MRYLTPNELGFSLDSSEASTDAIFFDPKKTIIFSPLGMGILDLLVANYLYEESQRQNLNIEINNFKDKLFKIINCLFVIINYFKSNLNEP